MGCLAPHVDVHVDPAPVAERQAESGSKLDDPELRALVESTDNRIGAGVTAPALVVDGPVQPPVKLDIVGEQQLEDGPHPRLVAFALADALPEDGRGGDAVLGGTLDASAKRIVH